MPNRQTELRTMLHELRLPTMAAACPDVALKAAREGISHEAFLYELARLECEGRQQRRIDRLLAQSGLPQEKTFATFQVERLSLAVRGQIERLRPLAPDWFAVRGAACIGGRGGTVSTERVQQLVAVIRNASAQRR